MNVEQHVPFLTDVGFEVVCSLGSGVFGAVYLAKQGRERVAVKVPLVPRGNYPDERRIELYLENINHIKQEHEAYVRAHGISLIPCNSNLYRYTPDFFEREGRGYANRYTLSKGTILLVRDFIVGRQMEDGETIRDKGYKKRLEKTVRECHSAGIFGLDIHRTNTIVGFRGKPCLIDFGHSLFGENLISSQLREYKESDFDGLRELFKAS
jgi:serine/threonine protein kinase